MWIVRLVSMIVLWAYVQALITRRAHSELPAVVSVGIPNDMNGPFADQCGRGLAEKHRILVATSDMTGKFCKPTKVRWTMDTYTLGGAMAWAITARGGDSWYFISFDYALERDATVALIAGLAKHPLRTTAF